MVNCDIVSGALILVLAFLAFNGQVTIPVLFVFQVFVGIATVFFESASGGMIPALVHRDQLAVTNSRVAALRTSAGILGPVAGAALYTSVDITLLFFINGISFLLSAVSEMFIRYNHIRHVKKSGIKGIFEDMKEGGVYIRNNKIIYSMSLYLFIIITLVGPVFILVLPLIFKTKLDYSDTGYGILQTFQVIGSLFGVILTGILSKKLSTEKVFSIGNIGFLFVLGVFSFVLCPMAYSTLGNDSLSYFLLLTGNIFFISMAFAFIGIPVQTLIQQSTPPEYMSRVFSIVGLISKGGIPLGAFLLGLIINQISLHWTMIGVMFVLMPLVLIMNRRLSLYI